MRADSEDPLVHEVEPKSPLRRLDAFQAAVEFTFLDGDDLQEFIRDKKQHLLEADPAISPSTLAMLIVAALPKTTQIELLAEGMPGSPAEIDQRLTYAESLLSDCQKGKVGEQVMNINVNEVSSDSNNSSPQDNGDIRNETGCQKSNGDQLLKTASNQSVAVGDSGVKKPLSRRPYTRSKPAPIVARIASIITKCTEKTLDGRKIVEAKEVPEILHKYHDDPDLGGHDPFWITYMKIIKYYYWPAMRRDIEAHVRKCEVCDKITKIFPRNTEGNLDQQIVSEQIFNDSTVQVTYTEFNGLNFITVSTQASLICKSVALERDLEAGSAVETLLEDPQFEDVKKVSFQSDFMATRKLRKYLRQRKIRIVAGLNPEINDVLWKLKRFMLSYPKFEGGSEACLVAAVKHHNWSQENQSETLKTRSLLRRTPSAAKYLAYSSASEEIEETRRAITLPRSLPKRRDSTNARSETMYNRKILNRL